MTDHSLSPQRVEEILRKTLRALENGKSQMYDVAESARQECNRLHSKLEQLNMDMQQIIKNVERLEKVFHKSRVRLYQINRDYEQYSEKEKADVYGEAERLRESLAVARERESILREQRGELEQSLVRMQDIAAKAE